MRSSPVSAVAWLDPFGIGAAGAGAAVATPAVEGVCSGSLSRALEIRWSPDSAPACTEDLGGRGPSTRAPPSLPAARLRTDGASGAPLPSASWTRSCDNDRLPRHPRRRHITRLTRVGHPAGADYMCNMRHVRVAPTAAAAAARCDGGGERRRSGPSRRVRQPSEAEIPTVGRPHGVPHLLPAFPVAVEVAVLDLDTRAGRTFGDEAHLHLAGLVRVGLELPLRAHVPAHHQPLRRLVDDHAPPVALAAV